MEFNPNATAAYLTGKIDEYVKFGGRDTLQKNASRDPAARYARIPDGGACDFCRMLGSRGFVYHTEETAGADGNDYHPNCNCQVAVTFQPDMLFYEKNGVTVSRGYQGSETYVVKTGRDGSDKLRKVDIDELYDEYLAMGKRFKSTSSYRSYPSHVALTQPEFDAAMKALEDAQTLEELHDAGARIVDQWKLKSKGGALDDDQWRELSKRAKELEAMLIERETAQMSEAAERFTANADNLRKKVEKQEDRALKRMERDYEFAKDALAGSNAEYTKIQAFYQGADSLYFKAKMFEAREQGIRQAIKDNPAADNEYYSNAELEAAKQFAQSSVTLPDEVTGRSTDKTPRTADMRGYFDKDGNPINTTAHDGGYAAWKKSWGRAFADKERKRRS